MSPDQIDPILEPETGADAELERREFLKTAAKVAATAPAVSLLLSARATPAHAWNVYGDKPKGDDDDWGDDD